MPNSLTLSTPAPTFSLTFAKRSNRWGKIHRYSFGNPGRGGIDVGMHHMVVEDAGNPVVPFEILTCFVKFLTNTGVWD